MVLHGGRAKFQSMPSQTLPKPPEPKLTFRSAALAALALLLCACAGPQLGGPVAPRGDPDAGLLTLPGGRTVPIYPDELAYTGEGLYRWPDGREYDGTFVAGIPEGMGSERLPSGEAYRGTWRAGKRDGHGELTLPGGRRYVGDFAEGLREGEGSERSPGGIYRGNWADDAPNGYGEYFGDAGERYRGQWRRGQRDGFGSYDDGQGNGYEGDWVADSPTGFGTMTSASGTRYEGQLRGNVRHGYGRLAAGGFAYEGTWREGKRHGYGRAETPDGGSYVGEWQNGDRHGLGRATNADGSFHDGSWDHDQALGPGRRVDASGVEISGAWNDDSVPTGLLRLPNGAEYAGQLLKREGRVAPQLVRWLEGQAGAGNAQAQLFLGTVFTDYRDPLPDRERALALFLAAASAGLPVAEYRAGLALLAGPAPSPEDGIRLLSRAAANGHADASALLGEYYATGTYVARDTSVAVTYFSAASERGNLSARNNLAWILATYPDSMLRDGARAVELMEPLAMLYDNWRHLDTLAAAYAETGEFERAASTQARALERAGSAAGLNPQELEYMQARLALYEQGERFRETGRSFEDNDG